MQENTLNHRFDIGSISKQFTAAAILELVSQGKLGLDQPINTLLGSYASDRWKKVTEHHLLSHQSGIPGLFSSSSPVDV